MDWTKGDDGNYVGDHGYEIVKEGSGWLFVDA